MSFSTLNQSWKKSFEDSISSIEEAITPRDNDCEQLTHFRLLTQWLIDTPIDPHKFMPQGYQDYHSDPYSMHYLFNLISHALLDDSDISFVKVIHKDTVLRHFILFTHHLEDCFYSLCLKENQALIDSFVKHSQIRHKLSDNIKKKNISYHSPHTVAQQSDFEFVAHTNVLQFISDVDCLEQEYLARLARSGEMRKKFI